MTTAHLVIECRGPFCLHRQCPVVARRIRVHRRVEGNVAAVVVVERRVGKKEYRAIIGLATASGLDAWRASGKEINISQPTASTSATRPRRGAQGSRRETGTDVYVSIA